VKRWKATAKKYAKWIAALYALQALGGIAYALWFVFVEDGGAADVARAWSWLI